MGNVSFGRKKVLADELEELQRLTKEIDRQIDVTLSEKNTVQWFSTLILTSLIGVSIAFSVCKVEDKNQRAVYTAVSLLTGFSLIHCLHLIISTFYDWCIGRKKKARDEVVRKKAAILEKVKETEVFKVAQDLLVKYDDTSLQKVRGQNPSPAAVLSDSSEKSGSSLSRPKMASSDASATDHQVHQRHASLQTALTFPPRPFFKQYSLTEKFIDYLLGYGANYRYALICSHCHEHNGMAKEEEFDYVAYRCWVCGEFNPARKQVPGRLNCPNNHGRTALLRGDVTTSLPSIPNTTHSNEDEKPGKQIR